MNLAMDSGRDRALVAPFSKRVEKEGKKGGVVMAEEKIGMVIKYFAKIGVAAIQMEGSLSVGDTIHIQGHTTDFTQDVDSMQIENQSVERAGPGADVGIKVQDRVREHDVVYKITD